MAGPSFKQVQNVRYRQKHLWDIRFLTPPPPEPFGTEWFPATGITDTIFNIVSHTFETTIGTIAIPKSTDVGSLDLQVTFYDTIDCVIEEWLTDWHRFMFPMDGFHYTFVRRLGDVVGKVEVAKLGYDKKPVLNHRGDPMVRTLFVGSVSVCWRK
jgi:hypothetical protein